MNPYQPPAQFSNTQNAHPIPSQDAQSRYPQLPPVNNNNNQNYPPQYPHHQQQQQSPIMPSVNHQGYVSPSNQYALLGVNPIIPDSRTLMKNKIRDIELRIENGLCLYKNWLLLLIVGGGLLVAYFSVFCGVFMGFDDVGDPLNFFDALVVVIFGIWLIQQGLSQRKAIQNKDLIQAKKAFNSMCWFAFCHLGFLIHIFIRIINDNPYEGSYQLSFGGFIVFYVAPMWINIAGARKVRNLLEKRDAFALELDTRYANNA